MRRLAISLVLILGLGQTTIAFAEGPNPANAEAFSGELSSEAVVLQNLETGDIWFEKDAQQQRYMASLTKLMTAILISENYSLKKKIVSKKDYKPVLAKYSGSMSLLDAKGKPMPIRKGEVFSAKELFEVMMLYSANDAALLFADAISGSEKAFVKKMNARAKALGLKHTRFTNCHGLSSAGDEEGQYTTASDVALLAKIAYGKPQVKAAVSKTEAALSSNFRKGTYKTSNKLTSLREGVMGLKTGYTKLAGNCFASVVSLNGQPYLAVTLGAELRSRMFEDHLLLYNWLEIQLGIKPPPDFENLAVTPQTIPGAEGGAGTEETADTEEVVEVEIIGDYTQGAEGK